MSNELKDAAMAILYGARPDKDGYSIIENRRIKRLALAMQPKDTNLQNGWQDISTLVEADPVLLFDGTVWLGWIDIDEDWPIYRLLYNDEQIPGEVTHWMPLPKPPLTTQDGE